jgi:hypothetical protein
MVNGLNLNNIRIDPLTYNTYLIDNIMLDEYNSPKHKEKEQILDSFKSSTFFDCIKYIIEKYHIINITV